jgi:hypothetical protein
MSIKEKHRCRISTGRSSKLSNIWSFKSVLCINQWMCLLISICGVCPIDWLERIFFLELDRQAKGPYNVSCLIMTLSTFSLVCAKNNKNYYHIGTAWVFILILNFILFFITNSTQWKRVPLRSFLLAPHSHPLKHLQACSDLH